LSTYSDGPAVLPFSSRVITIQVDDAGPGIPESERAAIFERFRRGSAQRSGSTKGTGLGLSLVAEHARLHGGSARVEVSPAGGARFIVELKAGVAGSSELHGLDAVEGPPVPAGENYG
jgi:two-component system, OmpR family, sensor histidine kinase MtrB